MRYSKEDKAIDLENFYNLLDETIGGSHTKLDNINKKLLKDLLKKELPNFLLFLLDFSRKNYYNWEVDEADLTLNKNFSRLIYILNDNIEMCRVMLEEECLIEDDGKPLRIKSAEDIVSYKDLAEKVGL